MLTSPYVEQQIAEASRLEFQNFTSIKQVYAFALHSVDLTTLEGSDTVAKVQALCARALELQPAAVCVYPVFAREARACLCQSNIQVACVAGAFPAGQSPIEVKLAEVAYAVAEGANEIDMVISRGKFLEGRYEEVYNEISAIRSKCEGHKLKVILETGELQSIENIYEAAMLAMKAGADYIKTSTGKIQVNATPQAFTVMLHAIKDYYALTGKMVGIKPAGGISAVEDVLLYVRLLELVLGKKWLSNVYFRIGTSRLADKLAIELVK